MRTFSRDLVFAFAGTVGLAGAAYAHPAERGDRVERPSMQQGSPPERFVRPEITIRIHNSDGRGDTVSHVDRFNQVDHRFDDRNQGKEPVSSLRAPELPPLPIATVIRNRVELRTDGDDPKSLEQRTSSAQQRSDSGRDSGRDTYRAPSNQAPVPIKSDIILKAAGGGEDSLVAPVVRPEDNRAFRHSGHDPNAMRPSYIGDATQAELRDPRTYGPLGSEVPTPAAMFMKASINAHRHSGGSDQKDEK